MKIVIDATALLLPSTGIRNYLHYWLRSLVSLKSTDERIATYPFGLSVPAHLDHEHSVDGKLGTGILLNLTRLLNIRGNPAMDFALLGADLFHASQHTANFPRSPRVTATIFDLSCWRTPQYHTIANVIATRRYGQRILQSADGLIAISGNSRDDAIDVLRIPADRIRVIYPGVAEAFFHVTESERKVVQTTYRIDRPYLLFLGCIEPRKNVRAIVKAYNLLPSSLRRDVQLIIAGPFGWETEETRDMLAADQQHLRYLGYVPERDLPGLVAGALALVYPSFYEGFGLPAAQAMAAGVPVVGSDRSCLPEVIGDGGILVNPDSVEELSMAFHRLCTSPEMAAHLGLRGRSRAQRFRWSECAAQSLSLFREICSRRL